MPICPVCRENTDSLLYRDFSVYRCPACSHIFYHSAGLPDELRSLYERGYFSGDEYYDYESEKKSLSKNFGRRLDDILRLKPSGRLLEIGCAYGYFLELAIKHFDVEGIDVSDEIVSSARRTTGVNIVCGDYLNIGDKTGYYDVICMWDVIEHLEDPAAVLAKAFRELRPGGILAFTTGDAGSFNARIRKDRWRLMHPPTHIHYFTARSVKHLLSGIGFDVQSIRYPGVYRSLGAMIYSVFIDKRAGRGGMFTSVMMSMTRLFVDVSLYLNFHDIMLVIARKP